jgi:hypothetical protein
MNIADTNKNTDIILFDLFELYFRTKEISDQLKNNNYVVISKDDLKLIFRFYIFFMALLYIIKKNKKIKLRKEFDENFFKRIKKDYSIFDRIEYMEFDNDIRKLYFMYKKRGSLGNNIFVSDSYVKNLKRALEFIKKRIDHELFFVLFIFFNSYFSFSRKSFYDPKCIEILEKIIKKSFNIIENSVKEDSQKTDKESSKDNREERSHTEVEK